jgi:hypothetical protein
MSLERWVRAAHGRLARQKPLVYLIINEKGGNYF